MALVSKCSHCLRILFGYLFLNHRLPYSGWKVFAPKSLAFDTVKFRSILVTCQKQQFYGVNSFQNLLKRGKRHCKHKHHDALRIYCRLPRFKIQIGLERMASVKLLFLPKNSSSNENSNASDTEYTI